MAELWLVCEGEPGSVDVALLQRVFADVLAAEIVVEPACGGSPSPVARDTAYAEITTDAYVRGAEFLIDFHGRDLLKAFRHWLASLKIQLSYERLCIELIPAAIQQYRDNRAIYGDDDFRDLANGVRSLAGLAPLA